MNSRFSHVLRAAAIVALSFSFFAVAEAKSVVPPSQVVVAETTGNALIIWDASVPINELRVQKISDDQLMPQLEATAGKILLEKAQKLSPAATSVTVRVLYASTALAELYKTATFSGFNKLLTVSASRSDAITKSAAWQKTLDGGTIPSGMTVTVLGKLPKS